MQKRVRVVHAAGKKWYVEGRERSVTDCIFWWTKEETEHAMCFVDTVFGELELNVRHVVRPEELRLCRQSMSNPFGLFKIPQTQYYLAASEEGEDNYSTADKLYKKTTLVVSDRGLRGICDAIAAETEKTRGEQIQQ